MSSQLSRDDIRERAFAYWCGNLVGEERAKIEEALIEDEELATYFEKVRHVALASRDAGDAWSSERSGASWDKVAAAIDVFDDDATSASEGSRGFVFAAAAIALCAIGAAALYFAGGFGEGQRGDAGVVDAPLVAEESAPMEFDIERLDERAIDDKRVALFAAKSTSWKYEADAGKIALDEGAVVVEFVPEHEGQKLVVETPDARVDVVGTVFSVSYQDGQTHVAVYEGAVNVFREQAHAEVRVAAGERLGATQREPVKIDAERVEQLDGLIDLEQHRVKLEQVEPAPARVDARGVRKEVRPERAVRARDEEPGSAEPVAKAERVAGDAGGEPVVSAREVSKKPPVREKQREEKPAEGFKKRLEAARSLERSGNYDEAVTQLVKLSADVPRRGALARSIELDIARIALHRLGDKPMAREHLRIVVERWPGHPAAKLSRQQLCNLGDCVEE